MFGSTVIEKTSPGSVSYSLELEGIDQDWQRYSVCVHTRECAEDPKLQGREMLIQSPPYELKFRTCGISQRGLYSP